MQLLLPVTYTAITLGISLVRSSQYPRTVSSVCLRIILRVAPRPPLALRSSISSDGSLLFVVCPSRISTHSVSSDTSAHYYLCFTLLSPPTLRPWSFLFPISLCVVGSSGGERGHRQRGYRRLFEAQRGDQNGDGVGSARCPCIILRNQPRLFRESDLSSFSQTPLQMQSRVQTMTSRTASCI